mgnify:CR=1 FL=1
MKIDKTKLMEDIEAMREKLASMEKQLNEPEKFKHFPSEGDVYYFYTFVGTVCRNIASSDKLKINVYKTEKETQNAYNKAVAVEKVKRRIIELQGDWQPDWTECAEEKLGIQYDHNKRSFRPVCWFTTQSDSLIPFMENEQIAVTIIYEMENELKLIFDIS